MDFLKEPELSEIKQGQFDPNYELHIESNWILYNICNIKIF